MVSLVLANNQPEAISLKRGSSGTLLEGGWLSLNHTYQM